MNKLTKAYGRRIISEQGVKAGMGDRIYTF